MESPSVTLLRTRVSNNPYDVDAWDLLVDELAKDVMTKPPELRSPMAVERLLDVLKSVVGLFPTASKQWRLYADVEIDRNNLEGAKDIFGKCLLNCLNVDLWRSYLRYIHITNEHKGDMGAQQIMQAYEFSLDKLGWASAAGVLWQEYLGFLSSIRIGTSRFTLLFQPTPGQEQSARAARLRTYYQRALQVPSAQLDVLWGDYERFEHSTTSPARSQQVVARFIGEMRPRWQAARVAWGRRQAFLERLNLTALPAVPGRSPKEGEFADQRRIWTDFLEYELRNEQGLEPRAHQARVNLSFQQALYVLRNCPEVWYQYAMLWMGSASEGATAAIEGVKHAVGVLTQARVALPDCVMLSFAQADLEEGSGQVDRARSIYEELAKRMEDEDSDPAGALPAEPGSVVWMQFMRFVKRTGLTLSAGQTDARRVFMRARKWSKCTWHVYVCHALMEWQLQRQLQPDQMASSVTIVKRIFELGLNKEHVRTTPSYLEIFADWLVNTTGDVENARANFEGVMAEPTGLNNPEMWDAFLRFEHQHGTLHDVMQLESRRAAALSHEQLRPFDSFQLLLRRSTVQGQWGCSLDQRHYLEGVLRPADAARPVSRVDERAGEAALPQSVELFLSRLPPGLEPDQPVPDIELVISIIMSANLDAVPGLSQQSNGGEKRKADAADNAANSDVFRMRQRQRVDGS